MVRGNSNRKGLAELPTGVVCDAMHVLQLGAQLGSYVLQVLDNFGARGICFLGQVVPPPQRASPPRRTPRSAARCPCRSGWSTAI